MANCAELAEILDLDESPQKRPALSREAILAKNKVKRTYGPPKRPENIPREVWGLRFDKDALPPLMPSDQDHIYKRRAKLGQGRCRPWRWTPFRNPARNDSLVLYHWRRVGPETVMLPTSNNTEEGTSQPLPPPTYSSLASGVAVQDTYDFSKFNKHVEIPQYTEEEYKKHFTSSEWSREETDYLLQQCRALDLRFIIITDRWDRDRFKTRSVEDIKERFYKIMECLDSLRGTGFTQGFVYDADHERRRKRQLARLMERTAAQVEEEANLQAELRRIDMHKKDREKKTQDLQRLITQAEQATAGLGSGGGGMRGAAAGTAAGGHAAGGSGLLGHPHSTNDLLQLVRNYCGPSSLSQTQGGVALHHSSSSTALTGASSALDGGLKFPEMKNPGVYLRSSRLKLPVNLGQRKQKMLESFLQFYHIDLHPVPTHEIVESFNELRNDILLLHELHEAVNLCDYELHSMRLKFMHLAPGKPMPPCLSTGSGVASAPQSLAAAVGSDILAALRAVDSKRTMKASTSFLSSASTSAATSAHPQHSGAGTSAGAGAHHSSSGAADLNASNASTSSLSDFGGPRKKRAAAMEQANVMKQLKNRGQLVDDN